MVKKRHNVTGLGVILSRRRQYCTSIAYGAGGPKVRRNSTSKDEFHAAEPARRHKIQHPCL